MLCALDFYLSSPVQVVLSSQNVEEAQAFVAEISRHFLPNKIVVFSQSGVTDNELFNLIPLIKDKVAIQGKPTVYICENYTCKAPITDLEELKLVLSRHR